MPRAPIFAEIERRKKVENIFRRVLSACGLASLFDEQILGIGQQVVIEKTGNGKKLSEALLNFMFPAQKKPSELFHYTTLSAFHAITASQQLRLTVLRKRIGQGELDTFAEKHSLKGYLDSSAGEPYFKELSDDIFYTSFADPAASDANMLWASFSEDGTGVRLKFRLEPGYADLRPMQYENNARTLLAELNHALASDGEPPFLPWTISRIGAFYLPSTLRYEGEVRLVLKRHKNGLNEARSDAGYEYWPIPIGSDNLVCRIELCDIAAGPRCDPTEIERIIQSTPFETVSVI
jgi:hypothetical protein